MAGKYHHEAIYRGSDALGQLARVNVTLCGAGALGSHLADNLARQGFRQLSVIDRDRVEEHNVSTQIYGEADVGAWKVDVLRSRLFKTTGVEIGVVNKELTERTARKLLKSSGIVVDTFDNSTSRRLVQDQCREHGLACLHAGLYSDYGEVVWDENYRIPGDADADVCDYPLARNLVLLTVAVTTEVLIRHVLEGTQQSWSITLRDFVVRPLEALGKT